MKLIGIKANNGFFIKELTSTNYHTSTLGNYLINGENPTKSFKDNWFNVGSKPEKMQIWQSQTALNKRYELKDLTLSDKFKSVWDSKEARTWDDDDDCYINSDGFIPELYEYKEDKQDPKLVDVEFEYTTIQDVEIDLKSSGFSYKKSGQYKHENYGYLTEKELQYDYIQQIITPELLLPFTPCKLSVEDSYKIIRAYVKDHINPMVAEITSDYDFCFTVKKKIHLAKPYNYQVNISRTKRPKYETRLQSVRTLVIFECAPKPYQSYTIVTPFKADNAEDMKEVIDAYLTELITVINTPLVDCECCNGSGVVIKNIKPVS